jgi:hypothetical protein
MVSIAVIDVVVPYDYEKKYWLIMHKIYLYVSPAL